MKPSSKSIKSFPPGFVANPIPQNIPKRLVITIDGPAGAGKTTVSRILADCLGYRYVDTGALYRAIAVAARSAALREDDDDGLEGLCRRLDLKFISGKEGPRLFLNDSDITDKIRDPEIAMFASAISARSVIRKFLLGLQRDMAKEKGVVFEGRDMGTVVFPKADVKFFLTASHKARALRRYKELEGNTSQTLEDVERELRHRDKKDSQRTLAPLKAAPDAIRIDSTHLSIAEVVERMLSHAQPVF